MTAQVHDQGAHLVTWAPAGDESALWLSPRARFEPGEPIRGGVPLCFPWFGTGPDSDRTPVHGFARTAPWRLVSENTSDGVVTLSWELTDRDATMQTFPGPYRATYTMVLGSRLQLALTVTNLGDAAFAMEVALHAYLAVSDTSSACLEGLENVPYVDMVHGGEHQHAGPLHFTEETDRIYLAAGALRLTDTKRTLLIETHGAANAVVWNPHRGGARDIADIGADSWSRFVCVEAANVLGDRLLLQSGESHTMGYELTVLA